MAQWVELRAVSEPVGMLRVAGAVLTLIAFSLAAAAGQTGPHVGASTAGSYWAWCLFCWVFCCLLSLLILLLELTRVTEQLQVSWDDFKAGFAMLAALMLLTASIIYPAVLFTCKTACALQASATVMSRLSVVYVSATVMSWLSVAPYVGQVVLLLRQQQQVSGFLSTVPGRLKIVETLVACVLFAALDPKHYDLDPECYGLCYGDVLAECGVSATVMSWLSVAPYVGQVVLLLRQQQQVSGFLSTVPGRLKVVETLVACVLFAALDPKRYGVSGPLQWCVAAYSLCFIGALAIIILTLSARLPPRLPFDPIVCTYNVLAACCYMSAAVVWPLYAFQGIGRPSCPGVGGSSAACLDWDALVVVTFMTIINLILYLLDSAYSIYVVVMQRRDN
ncbi:myeloid-associated differentiation marker-like protein 2 [Engraulis encrasicolus]|uniref:myeloid-associated differentiation marker-like protein 2 n=1 Tax=Engraulis encrasicolus TaxID=184585 RepID=UPI002FD3BB55